MCRTVAMRRVVLIADCRLEELLLAEIERLGFLMHNRVDCCGKGGKDVFSDGFSGRSRVRIEALGTRDIAVELLDFVQQPELRRYSIVSFMDVVEVDERMTAQRVPG